MEYDIVDTIKNDIRYYLAACDRCCEVINNNYDTNYRKRIISKYFKCKREVDRLKSELELFLACTKKGDYNYGKSKH